MYEYHGWLSLRESPSEIDGGKLGQSIVRIEQLIAEFPDKSAVVGLKRINGMYSLWITGHSNHKSDCTLKLFKQIATEAPRTYGVLFIWDDEDLSGLSNAFQVWKLARGNAVQVADTLLSPCVPTIED